MRAGDGNTSPGDRQALPKLWILDAFLPVARDAGTNGLSSSSVVSHLKQVLIQLEVLPKLLTALFGVFSGPHMSVGSASSREGFWHWLSSD